MLGGHAYRIEYVVKDKTEKRRGRKEKKNKINWSDDEETSDYYYKE